MIEAAIATPEPIGASNPKLKHLRALGRDKSERKLRGVFLVEGSKLIDEALRSPVVVEAIYGTAVGVRPYVGGDVPVLHAAAGALERIATVTSPQPVMAVVRCRSWTWDELCAEGCMVVVAVGLNDPGNLGTILRTAEASGVGGVVSTTGTAEVHSPKVVRASAGSVFRVPVIEDVEPTDALRELRARGYRLVGATTDGESYDGVDLSGRVALVMGSESHGLSSEVLDALDERVGIPMRGSIESLNVAIATAVLCFEAARQRQ